MSEELNQNRLNTKRTTQVRRDNDTVQDVSIGLYDIDETIKYYFDNIINLQVTNSSGILTPVPVSYASEENWKSLQKSKISRDSRGKLQLPFLKFKRDSITKDRNLGNKVDPNKPLYTTIDTGYNNRNRYDRFDLVNNLQGRKKVQQLQKIIVPDYITVTYTCMIFTEFLTQMNGLIEAISYGEGGYWGDKKIFSTS